MAEGAQVQEVSDGSTAANAGLAKGDVITKVDDQLITDADSLVATIRSYRPGDKVTVTYLHDGETKTAHAQARLGRRHVQVLTPPERPLPAPETQGGARGSTG